MSNQILISSGAKLRDLDDVIIGTDGVLSSLGFDVPYGVPRLDANGKILVSELPNSVMEFKGVWNAATNTPYLTNGVGNAGDVWLCNTAGTVDFGAGPITFAVGDYAVYTGSVWARSSGAVGTVTSVAVSRDGDALAITGSPITSSGTINIGFTGTSAQYINGAGNLTTFPTIISEAQNLVTEVYNETGATLTKGTIVYINGGHGNLPTVTKAIATSDATSAQTYGVVRADITNMNNGYVTVIGSLNDLDTQAYPAGTQLYLSGTTAGAWTSTKPQAPVHLVYVGIVVRSHPTQGVVEIKIQNGYELDELHDVQIISPTNGNILQYDSATSLWENVAGTTTNIAEGTNLYFTNARARNAISLTTTGSTGPATYDSATGILNIPNYVDQYVGTVTSVGLSAPTGFSVLGSPVTSSGTLALSFASGYSLPTTLKQSNWDDAYTWVAAFPTQTGNAGKFLTTDGSTLSWASNPLGTVTSVAMTVPTGLSVAGSPITTSGTLAVTFAAGYSIPTNASQANWDTAYTNRITSLTTTGSSGSATLVSNTLNIPTYTLSGLGGQPLSTNLTSLSGLTYVSTSFVKMTSAGTFTLDTNTYALASSLGSYLPLSGGTMSGSIIYSGSFLKDLSVVSRASIIINWAGAGYFGLGPNGTHIIRLDQANPTTGAWENATDVVLQLGTKTVLTDSDIGVTVQAKLTNPITGTGTANKIAKFNGTTSLADSSFTDTAGTAATLIKDGVNGASALFSIYPTTGTNASILNLDNSGAGSFYIGRSSSVGGSPLTSVGAYDTVMGNSGTQSIHFVTSSNPRVTIFGDGNTSIGNTTNAGYKLDVVGTGRFYLSTYQKIETYFSSPYTSGFKFSDNNGQIIFNAGTDNMNIVSNAAGGNITMGTNGSNKFTINSNNTIGIGSITPTATSLASIQSAYGILSGLIETNISSNSYYNSGWKYYSSAPIALLNLDSAGNFAFYTATTGTANNNISLGSPKLTLTNAGILLLGTSTGVTGGGALQVNGNVNINGVFQINGVTIGGGGGSGVTGSGTSGYMTKWTGSSTLGNSIIQDSGSSITVLAGVETIARFWAAGDGTIIIGGNAAQGTSSGEQYITYQNGTTNTNAWMVGMDDGEDFRWAYGAQGEITDANSLMKMSQSGYLGLGTLTPLEKLHVQDGNVSIRIQSTTGGQNANLKFVTTARTWSLGPNQYLGDSSFEFVDTTASASRMTIFTSGNVSINNVSSPTDNGYKLQVYGDLYVSGSSVYAGGVTYSGVQNFNNTVNLNSNTNVAVFQNIVWKGSTSASDFSMGNGGSGMYILSSAAIDLNASIVQRNGLGYSFAGTSSSYNVLLLNSGTSIDEITILGGIRLSTSSAGFIPPRMTTTQLNALSARGSTYCPNGTTVFDTTINILRTWNGSAWMNLW